MSEISGLWILEEDGNLLFSYETFAQGSEDYNSALFSGLILSIQQFTKTLGEKSAERIEMGNTKYFISKDQENDLIFVLKCSQEMGDKKGSKLLTKVQKKFNQKFNEFLKKFSTKELRLYIDNIFKTEIEEIFQDSKTASKDRVGEFFNSL